MSVQVDDRIGSREFHKPLKRMGLPVGPRPVRLSCADFAFTVNGPAGPLRVGVERKTVSEILAAFQDRRFAKKQLPRMLAKYDVVVLVVEGVADVARDGLLMTGKWTSGFGYGNHVYENYAKFQLTLAIKTRVIVWRTKNKTETAHFLHAFYRWGTKRWKDHKSAYVVDSLNPDTLILDERTVKRQVFAQFPGVGWERSRRVSKHFASIQQAVNANEREWMRALGIKEGTKIVRKLVAVLRGKVQHEAKG